MLTMDAKKNADSYSYPNGMLNTGWIAGVLRFPDATKGICYIQQTPNENHMLPIEFDPKTSPLPRDLREMDLVMAYVHMYGSLEGDQRVVRAKSIRFEAANAMHMSKDFAEALVRKWASKVHEAARNTGTPEAIQSLSAVAGAIDPQQRLDSFDWKAMKLNQNASNHIKLAGFIEAKILEQNRVGADNKPLNDRLIVLLRQHADADKSIAVRWYSRNLKPLADALTRGMPIVISGEYRLDVKAIGAPDPVTGFAPVSKIPYIQAKDMPQPVLPGKDDDKGGGAIRVVPAWLSEMLTRDVKKQQLGAPAAPVSGDATALFAKALGQQTQDAKE